MSKRQQRRKSVSHSKQKNDAHNQRRNELDKSLHVVSHEKRKDGTYDKTDADLAKQDALQELFMASLGKGKTYAGPSAARREELLQTYKHVPGENTQFGLHNASVREKSLRRSKKDTKRYKDPRHFEWYYEDQGQDDVRYHYLFRELNGKRYDQRGFHVEKGVETWMLSGNGHYEDDGTFQEWHEDDENRKKQTKKSKKRKKKNRQDRHDPEVYGEVAEKEADDDELGNDGDKQSQPKHHRAKEKSSRQRWRKRDGDDGALLDKAESEESKEVTAQDDADDQLNSDSNGNVDYESERKGDSGASSESGEQQHHLDAVESQKIQYGSINAESLLPLSREGTQGSDPSEVEPGSPRRREAKPQLNIVEDHAVAPHCPADFAVAAGVEENRDLSNNHGYAEMAQMSAMKQTPRGDESEEEAKNGAHDPNMRAKDKEITALKEQVSELQRTVAHLRRQEQNNAQLWQIIELLSGHINGCEPLKALIRASKP